ncbi:MAG: hypothetical protein OEW34_13225 [Burkholderiaceae bacterium]|jgi:hypothetical protein|nr:hypothetical protein [Burkholderiaceae bacterium]
MRIVEHFDTVIALDDGSGEVHALCARLSEAGCAPVVVDLAAPEGWRPRLATLLAQPRRARPTGVLLLSPAPGVDRELWKAQDRLVERLEFEEWEIAFLGHMEGAHCIPADLRPDLIECDTVPLGLSAVALRWRTLDSVIALMPDHGIGGPLSPSDWLTIFSWIAHPLLRSSRPLFAWPPLLHSQPAT